MISNLNAFTFEVSLDQTGDENSMAHMGYGESNTILNARVYKKPGINRGIQTVLLCDAYRNRSRAYLYQHYCYSFFEDAKSDK